MAAAGWWASGGRLSLIRGNISTRLWRTTRSCWRLSGLRSPLELGAARLLTVVRLPGVDHRVFTYGVVSWVSVGVCSPVVDAVLVTIPWRRLRGWVGV